MNKNKKKISKEDKEYALKLLQSSIDSWAKLVENHSKRKSQ